MEFVVLGWPDDGPRLRLDYRRFAYAGKFVTAQTGKAVLRDDDPLPPLDDERPSPTGGPDSLPPLAEDVVAAVAFNEDRTDPTTLWIRYVTVRRDRRGAGLGPELLRETADAIAEQGYETVRIATNNPFAYEACHKAGFGWTGRETGMAELVLERPADTPASVSRETYQSGLDRYRARDLDDRQRSFLATREGTDPPSIPSEDS
ncbi:MULTISPECIES: GNAT family N-acetyltransferase [Haloferax]|uniref:GNAT family N-acetyltransferase n=1 Tax=Haloferax marinum TaxID=2666143 RepID=A0A6A8G2R2_9EURY|nr:MULTISPECIES: GNAT family N-acetyltransferase [Haloferax]KAB1196009.1 GNAT family N-acetyltransferase [Haloferax sp. CBA1150]MRW94985.1 GNAT family N-acetyltransferase [Haloferax marinum]